MSIITISREVGALGEDVAKALSSMTKYRIIDIDYIERRLKEFGVEPYGEKLTVEKKPGFLEKYLRDMGKFLHYLKTVLYREASNGACIVLGCGGGSIFKILPNHVAVRVISNFDERIERVCREYRCEKPHAQRIIEKSDEERAGFTSYFLSTEWADPHGYDLIINTSRISATDAASRIDAFRAVIVDWEREEAGWRRLKELVREQNVITEVSYLRKIPIEDLRVAADGDCVTLSGQAFSIDAIDAALEAARAVPGVSSVKSVIQIVGELPRIPH